MKKIFLALAALSILAIACDKIESDQYLIYSGAAGEWIDGNGVNDHSQRAIIEKYTGVRCVNCPTADDAINTALSQYGDKLIAVAIHDSNLAFTRPIGDSPDLRTPDGDTWSKYFGVFSAGQYPTGIINRTLNGSAWDLFTPTSGINNRVDNIIGQDATVALQVDASISNSTVSINVNIELLQDITTPMTVTLFIMEDGIVATQRQPDGSEDENYIHNHVLRDVITDVWGADVDCTGTTGEKRAALFSYSETKSEWNLDNCHIVAMLSDKTTREIINVAECHLHES